MKASSIAGVPRKTIAFIIITVACVVALAVAAPSTSMARDRDAEKNAKIVREFVEKVYNEGRLDLIETYIAEDFVDSSPGAPPDASGPAFVRKQAEETFAIFPNLKFANEDVIADGDRVVVRWSSTSTFSGKMGEIAGDGRPVRVDGISIMRVKDGKIVQSWDIVDRMGMFTQMGFTVTPPKPPEAAPHE
jgi:predicted ester cyclase